MNKNTRTRSKGWIWPIAAVIVTLVVLVLLQRGIFLNYGKKGGSKPHLSVKRITVHDIGEDRISMTAQIMLSNPLLIELRTDSLQYQLLIDSVKILETDFVKPIAIRPQDSIMLTLPIEVFRHRLVTVLDQFERNNTDSADYTLKAKLFFDLPIAGEKMYAVNKTQRGPAIRMLKFRTEDVDIDKFGLKNSDMSMSLIVENPNLFEISFTDVDYDLFVGKDFHMEGDVNRVINIPAHATIALPLKMDVHTKNIARLAWQVLFEKKHTPFRIVFKAKMVSTNDAFKETRLRIKRTGRLDELKKTMPDKDDPK